MILHQDVDAQGIGELHQPAKAIGGQLPLFLRRAGGLGVHPDGMAPQELGRLHPAVVVLHGLGPSRRVRISDGPLTVAHDEEALNAEGVAAGLQLGEIDPVPGPVLEEGIHVLHRSDVELLSGHPWKVQVVQPPGIQGPVERPLGQGDAEEEVPSGTGDTFGTGAGVPRGRPLTRGGLGATPLEGQNPCDRKRDSRAGQKAPAGKEVIPESTHEGISLSGGREKALSTLVRSRGGEFWGGEEKKAKRLPSHNSQGGPHDP